MLDVGLDQKIVQKSGSYFSFDDERLGQGRQNAIAFLREHPDVAVEIVSRIRAALGQEVAPTPLPTTPEAESEDVEAVAEVA